MTLMNANESSPVGALLNDVRHSPDLEGCAQAFAKAISIMAGADICFVNLHDEVRNVLRCVSVVLPPEMEHLRTTYTNIVLSSGSDNYQCFTEQRLINITQANRDQFSASSRMAMDCWKLRQIVVLPLLSLAENPVCAGSVALMIRGTEIPFEKIEKISQWLRNEVMLLYLHMNYRAAAERSTSVRDAEAEIDKMLEFVAETVNLTQMEEIFPVVLKEYVERFDQDIGAIWMAKGDQLHCVACHTDHPEAPWFQHLQQAYLDNPYSANNAGDGTISYVFCVGQHLLLENVPATLSLTMPKKDAHLVSLTENLLSLLLYPIRRHGKAIGVLGLYSLRSTKGIPLADVERISYWSDFLGAVLENSGMYSRLEARSIELARSNAELAETLDSLRKTQEELLRSKKLSALGSIVVAVAHELNTPIGNAVSIASTVEEDIATFEEAVKTGLRRSALEQYLQDAKFANGMIMHNLRRACVLIEDFKEIAVNRSSAERFVFNPGETIREMACELEREKGRIPIELHLPPPSHFTCDSYRVSFCQVVKNLTSNAILHAFHGRTSGHIWIEVDALQNDHVRIRVTDDGIGIPEDHLDRIFDPFFTARLGKGRSGLGLYITYNMVTSVLGGTIEVSSETGIGTTFTVTIPMKAPVEDSVPGSPSCLH